MEEQIYVVKQRVGKRNGSNKSGLAEAGGFLWWSVLFPSGFITDLSLGEPHSQPENGPEHHRKVVDPTHLPPQIK